MGRDEIPQVEARDSKELAIKAAKIERETGADAGAIIFAWASREGDYGLASMAVKALYRDSGARRLLRDAVEKFVASESAPESDRSLLNSVFWNSERDTSAH